MAARGQHYSIPCIALRRVFLRRKERPRDVKTALKPSLRLQRLHLGDDRTAVDLRRATVFFGCTIYILPICFFKSFSKEYFAFLCVPNL